MSDLTAFTLKVALAVTGMWLLDVPHPTTAINFMEHVLGVFCLVFLHKVKAREAKCSATSQT